MLSQLANRNLTPFKGYDACPLKNIYMQGIMDDKQKSIYHELWDIGKKENFKVCYYDGLSKITDNDTPECADIMSRWIQDDKTFIKKGDQKSSLIASSDVSQNYPFARRLGLKIDNSDYFSAGGNVFIGQDKNGNKWMLAGVEEEGSSNLEEYCKLYDIKPARMHFLSQPNFHLDMAIRPIGYPYVLVNDEQLVREKVKDDPELSEKVDKYYNDLNIKNGFSFHSYMNADGTVDELKRAGFVPIRVAGVFGNDINYMNAIVGKHQDGTLTYITNSTRNTKFKKTDQIFLDELKRTVPNLKNAYFVSGRLDDKDENRNAIMYNLGELRGGIHCMTLEEPNFEAWG